jgi:hypothetical protein
LARERLVLILPPDPAYARLARLAALHFLRQHGAKGLEARRRARQAESRCKAALRAARKEAAERGLEFVFRTGAEALLVLEGKGARSPLLVVPHPRHAA